MLSVDSSRPNPDVIDRAAEVLRRGGLVAFPTETVYGLGANALDGAAVGRIFDAKGRPATNPIIVHIGDMFGVLNVAAEWSETAARLAARFWPGPLTLVVPKTERIPSIVTAGGPTVALRCPNHPVAQALIRAAGVPIAAPSANRSTELSPTRGEHVLKSLNGRIDILLDGGPCSAGIESTVVDVTGTRPCLLRPGPISVPMLEEVCATVTIREMSEGVARSPGQLARHYSPRTPLVLADNADAEQLRLTEAGFRAISLGPDQIYEYVAIPDDPTGYAAELYAALHDLDDGRYDRIVIALPPDTPEWAAVRDRLMRAAAPG